MKAQKILIVLALAGLAYPQSATPIRYPDTQFKTPLVMEPQALPATPTLIITGNSIIDGGFVSCAGTARNITFTDGNSVNLMTSVPVAANQIVGLSVLAGTYVPTSLTVSADGTGCTYQVRVRR